MIESIIMMHLVMLSTIQEARHNPPPIFPTPWIEGNLERRMAGDKNTVEIFIGFF
jgi:hypothetical protein